MHNILKARNITKEDIDYVRKCLQKAKVQQYPIRGYYYNTYFEINEKGKVIIMTDSYQINGMLLAAIEQSLSRFTQTDDYNADDCDVLTEVQALLRGDNTDGDQEKVTESEMDTEVEGTLVAE